MDLKDARLLLRTRRGVALVAVLSVLTILALVAATFAVLLSIVSQQTATHMEGVKLDLLTISGLQNASAMLQEGIGSPRDRAAMNGLLLGSYDAPYTTPWRYVRDSQGVIHGRYRLRIEDEAGKVNLNTACLTEPSKGSGWSSAEIDLAGALGLSKNLVASLASFRYGDDGKPGLAGVDDDRNTAVLMNDKIDNDADGTVDEEGEGIDDPGEYRPAAPAGDDRSFTGMGEVLGLVRGALSALPLADQRAVRKRIQQRATIYATDSPGSCTLPDDEPADLNCVVARECRRRIDEANLITPFEPTADRRNQLAVNMVDYRDENHVLSTYASTYGVEAVCFNEVMANDDTYSVTLFLTTLSRDEINGSYVNRGRTVPLDYWIDLCGSSDKEPLAFELTAPYCQATLGGWYRFDPREAWRINNAVVTKSSIDIGAGSLSFRLGDAPGPNGTTPAYAEYSLLPAALPGGLNWGTRPVTPGFFENAPWQTINAYYTDCIKLCGKTDRLLDGHPKLPPNALKNTRAMIYLWGKSVNKAVGSYEVTASTPDHHFTCRPTDALTGEPISSRLATLNATNNPDLSVSFDGWLSAYTVQQPNVASIVMMRSRRPMGNRYYKLMVTRRPKGYWNSDRISRLGVQPELNFTSFSTGKNKVWWYNDGTPVRTGNGGWLTVNLVTPPEVDWKKDRILELDLLRMVGLEAVELFNASARPVSLANWRVICNTGSLATQIGQVRRTTYFDPIQQKPAADDNPCVKPGSYFYLVNDTKLFDARYGNADNMWGSANVEKLPVFQMDEERWGIMYTIEKIAPTEKIDVYDVKLKDEKLTDNMFARETSQFLCDDNDPRAKDQGSIHGAVMPLVYPNAGPMFRFILNDVIPNDSDFTKTVAPKPGDRMMVLGLPYRGGLVSLTLKNEYEQVCTRMVDYGVTGADQVEYSNEKADPTDPTWYIRDTPSIGGTDEQAMNSAMRVRQQRRWQVKNAPYGSVGELYRVSVPGGFKALGSRGGDTTARSALGALASSFSASAIRLEAVGAGVEQSGWRIASDTVENSTFISVRARNGGWQLDQWMNHTLRFLTGPMRGESFPVAGNSPDTIFLSDTNSIGTPHSAPGRLSLCAQAGDEFCIGPGYLSPFAYTRTPNTSGEWLWRKRVPFRGPCWLYIHGLSDAIATTEFLEENYNAPVDVEVWNWDTKKFDVLCLRAQYRKEDCFNAGQLSREHISAEGDLKIKLTAHNVEELQQTDMSGKTVMKNRRTGFAWFNYASLTPIPVAGRLNANTASEPALASLPGIAPALASALARGIDDTDMPRLKPYRRFGDILKVKGMTLPVFERCANLLCVDSRTYTVEVLAQSLRLALDENIPDNSPDISASRVTRNVVRIERTGGAGSPGRLCVLDRYKP